MNITQKVVHDNTTLSLASLSCWFALLVLAFSDLVSPFKIF